MADDDSDKQTGVINDKLERQEKNIRFKKEGGAIVATSRDHDDLWFAPGVSDKVLKLLRRLLD